MYAEREDSIARAYNDASYINDLVKLGIVSPNSASKTGAQEIDFTLYRSGIPSHGYADKSASYRLFMCTRPSIYPKIGVAFDYQNLDSDERESLKAKRRETIASSRALLHGLQQSSNSLGKTAKPQGMLIYGSRVNPLFVPRDGAKLGPSRSDLDVRMIYSTYELLHGKKPISEQVINKHGKSILGLGPRTPKITATFVADSLLYDILVNDGKPIQDEEIPNWSWFPNGCVYVGVLGSPRSCFGELSEVTVNKLLFEYLNSPTLKNDKAEYVLAMRALDCPRIEK